MSIKLGVVMDPIGDIKPVKDSTLAMLLEAQSRGWEIAYMERGDLFADQGIPQARMRSLLVRDDPTDWFTLGDPCTAALADLDTIFMRLDPPFEMEYIYTTYLLELAERRGVLVVNKPEALRDWNEKLSTSWFPACAPPTLITRDRERIRDFAAREHDIVLKPLDAMGGSSIFHLHPDDPNFNVALEVMTQYDTRTVMAQRFIPEITEGDKRILLIDGEPIPFVLARIPPKGDPRGNLAVGAAAKGIELSKRDRWICEQIGPSLREKGLLFVGLDVIGNYLTEINVTSPTGIRELDRLFELNVAGTLLDAVGGRLSTR